MHKKLFDSLIADKSQSYIFEVKYKVEYTHGRKTVNYDKTECFFSSYDGNNYDDVDDCFLKKQNELYNKKFKHLNRKLSPAQRKFVEQNLVNIQTDSSCHPKYTSNHDVYLKRCEQRDRYNKAKAEHNYMIGKCDSIDHFDKDESIHLRDSKDGTTYLKYGYLRYRKHLYYICPFNPKESLALSQIKLF